MAHLNFKVVSISSNDSANCTVMAVCKWNSSKNNWWNDIYEKIQAGAVKSVPVSLVYYKSHSYWRGIEPRPRRWKASDQPTETWQGCID